MMGFSLFGWLRNSARDAVLGGVQDALQVLTPEGEAAPADLGELRKRLASVVEPKALAAAVAKEDAPPSDRLGLPEVIETAGRRKK